MNRNKTRPYRVAQAVWVLVAVSMSAPACTSPAMTGYQIQTPPDGFLWFREPDPSHRFLPNVTILEQGIWYGDIKSDEPRSSIALTEIEGTMHAEEMQTTWQARIDLFGQSQYSRISAMTEVVIDGRSGLAWSEERHDEYGRFRTMRYKSFVPYDSATYFIEFDSGVPERMTVAHLAAVVATFGLGRTTVHWNVIFGAIVLAAFGVLLFVRRMRPHHTTAYRLPRVPKDPTSSPPDQTPASPDEP